MPEPTGEQRVWLAIAGALFLMVAAAVFHAWGVVIIRLVRRERIAPEGWAGLARDSWLKRIDVRAVAAVALLYILLQLGAGVAYRTLRQSGHWRVAEVVARGEMPARDQILLVTAVNLMTAVMVPLVLLGMARTRQGEMGIFDSETARGDIRLGVGACLLAAPLIYGINAVASLIWKPEMHPVFESVSAGMDLETGVLAVVSAVIAAPLAEEMLFRGVLLGWLTRLFAPRRDKPAPPESSVMADVMLDADVDLVENLGAAEPAKGGGIGTDNGAMAAGWRVWIPNVLVSALFAMMHAAQWPAPVPLFLLSLVLGWLVQKTGRLTPAIVLHAAFNGFSTVLMVLLTLGGVKAPGSAPVEPVPVPVPAPVAPAGAPAGMVLSGSACGVELTRAGGDLGCEWWQRPRLASGDRGHAPGLPARSSSRIVQDRKWTNEAPPFCATWRRCTGVSRAARRPRPAARII